MYRQPKKGCPFECNLAEITRNETVWRMRTNNVKRDYSPYFCRKLGKMSQNLSSAAVVIGTLRVNPLPIKNLIAD